jgi:hypothetical protein
VELILNNGRAIPEDLMNELIKQSYYGHFKYFHDMIYYAIKWYNTGSSPSKLKRLMDEAIIDFADSDGLKGKRLAMRMFMDYLKHKKQIDIYIDQFGSSIN